MWNQVGYIIPKYSVGEPGIITNILGRYNKVQIHSIEFRPPNYRVYKYSKPSLRYRASLSDVEAIQLRDGWLLNEYLLEKLSDESQTATPMECR